MIWRYHPEAVASFGLALVALLVSLGLASPATSQPLSSGFQSPHGLAIAQATSESTEASPTEPGFFRSLLGSVGAFVKWLLIICVLALVLLLLVVALLLWKAKQLVANAVRSDPVALARLVERMRRKHPDLDDDTLCKKIILRQANRAGLVGFITGVGGLPAMPIALPIDIAATIRIQANMVHMIRLVRELPEDEVPDPGLWLAATGGTELVTTGGTALKKVVVGAISKSLLKFLPLIGGVIGFGLNWTSTQAIGRMGLQWLSRSRTDGS